jgi:hypothetical protein
MPSIQFYLDRDGEASARETVRMQLEVAVRAILNAQSHASQRDYRPLFIADAMEYCKFIGTAVATPVLTEIATKVAEKVSKMSAQDHARHMPFLRQFEEALDDAQGMGGTAMDVLSTVSATYPLDTPTVQSKRRALTVSDKDYEQACAILSAANIPHDL